MDRINYGEFYHIKCHLCGQNYLVRTGEAPVVAQLAHAVAFQKEHDKLQVLSSREWESELVRKVLPFPKLKPIKTEDEKLFLDDYMTYRELYGDPCDLFDTETAWNVIHKDF